MKQPRKEEIDWGVVRRHYDAGHSRDECKQRFGFSEWDWHAAVGRRDIVPRTRGPTVLASEKRRLIAELREEGLSYGRISASLGISKATVAYHVRRLGIPANDAFRDVTTGERFRKRSMKA